MVVALIALFVSLTGTAVAAKPVARALFANNAGKLQGSTRAQVISAAAASVRPAPVTSVRGLVSVATKNLRADGQARGTLSVVCLA